MNYFLGICHYDSMILRKISEHSCAYLEPINNADIHSHLFKPNIGLAVGFLLIGQNSLII